MTMLEGYYYEDDRNYITYSCGDEYGDAVFVRRCPECSRFVKPNAKIRTKGTTIVDEPNATCKVHGPVKMPFLGFF